MGTMLQRAGMQAGALPELLNLTDPALITDVHRQYVDAGSDMVITCTFGANEHKLAGSGHTVEEIIPAAVANARASGAKFVGLDIGPIGELLAPTGTLSFDDAYDIFARQIRCGAAAGVDAVYIETMSDLLEVKAAVLAAREQCDLPVFATLAFESTGRTFLGVPSGGRRYYPRRSGRECHRHQLLARSGGDPADCGAHARLLFHSDGHQGKRRSAGRLLRNLVL